MNPRNPLLSEINSLYDSYRDEISSRIEEFDRLWREGQDHDLFCEMAFCLFTPQSKAVSCWSAVVRLRERGLLLSGTPGRISRELTGVRFHSTKANRLVEARSQFTGNGGLILRDTLEYYEDPFECREWLVENVKGLGYKEASHFLRNIGRGERIAILDRHILKNLAILGVIEEVPKTMTRKRYLEIEEAMKSFARRVKIPMSHLDLVFWCKEAGEVFK